ncbi:MAG TPA: helix-turn-helix domain-containing protein [Virgibacillus sp.]|nr:helix-turn-helix domain-containing protein [Virgibacillus sp.]
MDVKLEPIKRSTLTVQEVAEYLGISNEMVYLLVREKRIVHFRIGRRILFKREAIDQWIESQMVEGMEDDY